MLIVLAVKLLFAVSGLWSVGGPVYFIVVYILCAVDNFIVCRTVSWWVGVLFVIRRSCCVFEWVTCDGLCVCVCVCVHVCRLTFSAVGISQHVTVLSGNSQHVLNSDSTSVSVSWPTNTCLIHRSRSSVSFGRQNILPNMYEKLTKSPNLHDICPKN